MPEPMVYIPISSRVDQPLEGETSRSLPDQVGNVAGANMDELADRIIKTGGGHVVEGPLRKVTAFWLSGMSCDGCSIAALGATEPSVEELLTGALPGLPTLVLHHYATAMESGDHFTHAMPDPEQDGRPPGARQRATVTASSNVPFDDDLEHAHRLPHR